MTILCTLVEWRQRAAGDAPVISGAYDATVIDIIADVSSLLEEEVRLVRGQPEGWSFLPPSQYGVQQVSISGSPNTGTFTLTSGASTTVAIAPAASAATVQAALDTILGASNTVVTGPPGGPWLITFAAALSGPQPVLAPASTFPAPIHAVVQGLVTGASAATVTRRYTGYDGGSPLLLIDDAVAVSGVRLLDAQGNLQQALTLGVDYQLYPMNSLPITGLQLTSNWWWPWYPGGVAVDLTPGYAAALPSNVRTAALQETTRVWRGAQVGEDDRLGTTPFGSVVVSKALLQSTCRMIERYRYGAGFLRRTA